jgi:hypothetical protein
MQDEMRDDMRFSRENCKSHQLGSILTDAICNFRAKESLTHSNPIAYRISSRILHLGLAYCISSRSSKIVGLCKYHLRRNVPHLRQFFFTLPRRLRLRLRVFHHTSVSRHSTSDKKPTEKGVSGDWLYFKFRAIYKI